MVYLLVYLVIAFIIRYAVGCLSDGFSCWNVSSYNILYYWLLLAFSVGLSDGCILVVQLLAVIGAVSQKLGFLAAAL